jgi:hypothetical protein
MILRQNATAYMTIITEQSPSPPQETIVPSQPTSPKPMQLDNPDPSENVEEPITLTTEALSQPIALSVPISVTLPSVESQQQEIPSLSPQNRKFQATIESSLNSQC